MLPSGKSFRNLEINKNKLYKRKVKVKTAIDERLRDEMEKCFDKFGSICLLLVTANHLYNT